MEGNGDARKSLFWSIFIFSKEGEQFIMYAAYMDGGVWKIILVMDHGLLNFLAVRYINI